MLRMYAAWLEWSNGFRHSRDQTSDGKRTRCASCIFGFSYCNFLNKCSYKSRHTDRDSSPEFGSSLAVGKDLSDSSLRNDSKIKLRCCQSSAKSSLAPKSTNRGKKQGHPGRSNPPFHQSRPNESHISVKGKINAPPAQIWNRELSGNPSFGVTNCKAIRVRRLLDAIKFTCGRFFAELSQ
jgi:hypothetical protein